MLFSSQYRAILIARARFLNDGERLMLPPQKVPRREGRRSMKYSHVGLCIAFYS
jgi:hypothetical protein